MTAPPARVGIVVDRYDWAFGTIGRQIARIMTGMGAEAELVTHADFHRTPSSTLSRLEGCDVVQWLSWYGHDRFRDLLQRPAHVCWLHHVLPGDGLEPERFGGTEIVTASALVRTELEARGFEDVSVVHYAADAERFRPLDRSECRRELGLAEDATIVGFFGKAGSDVVGRKGVDRMVAVVEALDVPELTVLFSGSGWAETVRTLEVRGVSVEQRSPEGAQMPVLFGAIDAYLCTSRVEGGPMPVIEAMASGRAVVTTAVGLCPELVHDGVDGLLVSDPTPARITERLRWVLGDAGARAAIEEAARRTVLSGWTWDQTLPALVPVYERAELRGARRRPAWRRARARALFAARVVRTRLLRGRSEPA